MTDFHVLPGTHPERETVLRAGEIITAIDVPALPFARRSLYLKVRDRASYAFALASAAVALDVAGGKIRDVARRVRRRRHEAMAVARGGARADRQGADGGDVPRRGRTPRSRVRVTHKDNAFKVELAKRTLVRALTEVAA